MTSPNTPQRTSALESDPSATSPRTGVAERLLPCPFCGGEAEITVGRMAFNDVMIECEECSTQGPTFDSDSDTAQADNAANAIACWNARSNTPATLGDDVGLVARLRALLAKASKGPWRKFESRYGNSTVAIMQGNQPRYGDDGYHVRKWKEIIAWTGFDGSDTPKHNHANAKLIVAAVNALPSLLDRIERLSASQVRLSREDLIEALRRYSDEHMVFPLTFDMTADAIIGLVSPVGEGL